MKTMIKRFIDIHVPVTACNLKCHYCYVAQNHLFGTEKITFKYSPETVKAGLSIERLGGICHFNVCGLGETLIPSELIDYIRVLLENGHYVMIVTNGLLTNRFKEYVTRIDTKLLPRLGFKFSFHYLELKRLNQFDVFFNNVRMVRQAGCSFSLEVTPSDELEPYIQDVIDKAMQNCGAKPHITVPRAESDRKIPILTKHTKEDFYRIWSVFDSPMLDFKMRHWQEKRKEYCYAGKWSGILDIGLGVFSPCYCQRGYSTNIFDHVDRPIRFLAVGKCRVEHCYNSHSFLTLGVIPEIREENYAQMRDRICEDGSHWLTPEMNAFLSTRLEDSNDIMTGNQKLHNSIERKKLFLQNAIKKVVKRRR